MCTQSTIFVAEANHGSLVVIATWQQQYISCSAGSSNNRPALYCCSRTDSVMIFTYQHHFLTYSLGLCVDLRDNIFVVNSEVYIGIDQVTNEDELIRVFLAGGYKAICFDEKG
ncbi:hypothetical protein CHS0354_038982 [Potamilus streckersoni]|uniref:Uncharacterized protein n=1 Tax=Potamilus streckersoni TaxID=2493646 RepID=A0AAE0VMH3_9BIVA|nr:hypothetical protein CHS0354_038982 [Potamilus streckersoni]